MYVHKHSHSNVYIASLTGLLVGAVVATILWWWFVSGEVQSLAYPSGGSSEPLDRDVVTDDMEYACNHYSEPFCRHSSSASVVSYAWVTFAPVVLATSLVTGSLFVDLFKLNKGTYPLSLPQEHRDFMRQLQEHHTINLDATDHSNYKRVVVNKLDEYALLLVIPIFSVVSLAMAALAYWAVQRTVYTDPPSIPTPDFGRYPAGWLQVCRQYVPAQCAPKRNVSLMGIWHDVLTSPSTLILAVSVSLGLARVYRLVRVHTGAHHLMTHDEYLRLYAPEHKTHPQPQPAQAPGPAK
jgi:hypothetical protein